MAKRIKDVIIPVLPAVLALLLLQSGIIHRILGIKVLQLPLPFDIADAFTNNIGKIFKDAAVTAVPAVTGLILGSFIGYGAAVLASAFPGAGYGILFILTMVNSVPIVALAPLMNRWFSSDFAAKTAVIATAASGAMAVNAFRGLNCADENTKLLMRASAASKLQEFIILKIPGSLPGVFTALKTGAPAAMLACIIGEFFSSDTAGLGYMIKYTMKVGNQKQLGWAYIAAASALSLLIYGIICLAERKILKWHASQRHEI